MNKLHRLTFTSWNQNKLKEWNLSSLCYYIFSTEPKQESHQQHQLKHMKKTELKTELKNWKILLWKDICDQLNHQWVNSFSGLEGNRHLFIWGKKALCTRVELWQMMVFPFTDGRISIHPVSYTVSDYPMQVHWGLWGHPGWVGSNGRIYQPCKWLATKLIPMQIS